MDCNNCLNFHKCTYQYPTKNRLKPKLKVVWLQTDGKNLIMRYPVVICDSGVFADVNQ